MSLCRDCISGVRHGGTPEGKIELIGGVKTYVATPTSEYPKDKGILFLSDAFGINFINSQLMADDFARNGFKVYLPDYLLGDGVPETAFSPGSTFDIMEWSGKHDKTVTRPPLDKVIDALKAQGVTQFAATGYCFGGRYVFDLAFDKVIKVGAVSHPSLLQVPQDLIAYKQTGLPLLINSCEIDKVFPPESQAKADEILGGGSQESESGLYKRAYFEGCTHGFAIRGDMSDPKVKAGKEGAFKNNVEFFWKHL